MHSDSQLSPSLVSSAAQRAGAAPNRWVALAATIASMGLVATTVIAPAPAFAAETRAGEIGMKIFDVAVLRPGGFLRTVIGGAFMVPASFFNLAALPFQGTSVYTEMAEVLVLEPARYTFRRPLGEDLEGE